MPLLEADEIVIGLFPKIQPTASSIEFEPVTLLALFTDVGNREVNELGEEIAKYRLNAALREAQFPPQMAYRNVLG